MASGFSGNFGKKKDFLPAADVYDRDSDAATPMANTDRREPASAILLLPNPVPIP
jgi:hypothetical protein